MTTTVIAKGSVVNNPDGDTIGRAVFVHCVATGATQTISVKTSSTVDGQIYLHTAGDSIIIEKHPEQTITLANGHASAVGSPRG